MIKKVTFSLLFLSLFAVLTLIFLVAPRQIKGESMLPTYAPNQIHAVNKLAYIYNPPTRGDVIIYKPSSSSNEFIARVVGLPGETVTIKNKAVLINGKLLKENYVIWDRYDSRYENQFQINDNQYLVLNDNRNGFQPIISKDLILGKVAFKIK